jgi:hypothetical protein
MERRGRAPWQSLAQLLIDTYAIQGTYWKQMETLLTPSKPLGMEGEGGLSSHGSHFMGESWHQAGEPSPAVDFIG